MRRHAIIFLSLLSLLILIFAGCTQDDIGIFYSLEIESELEGDKGLDDDFKVWEMKKLGSTYYIAAGKVFKRSATDDEAVWSEIESPSATEENMICSDIEVFNSTIYAVYRTQDGTSSKLYTLQDSSWSAVDTGNTALDSTRIAEVMVINNNLFISGLAVETTEGEYDSFNPYALWYTADGSTYASCALDNSTGTDDISIRNFVDGMFDGTNYWIITGDTIYRGTTAASLSQVSIQNGSGSTITLDGDNWGGIYYSSELDMMFISTDGAYIYTRDVAAGNAWYKSVVDEDNDNRVYYDFAFIPAPPDYPTAADTDNHIVIVGSDNGYYEITADDSDGNAVSLAGMDIATASVNLVRPGASDELTTKSNYLTTSLSTGTILGFFIDEIAPPSGSTIYESYLVFACTARDGLWQNRYSDTVTNRVWTNE